jgi:hypothetical protein
MAASKALLVSLVVVVELEVESGMAFERWG